jgi:hypothetical protein
MKSWGNTTIYCRQPNDEVISERFLTDWLLNQMHINSLHPTILSGADAVRRWRRLPLYRTALLADFLLEFKKLVEDKAIWDFKHTETFTMGECPSPGCKNTVTLCGACMFKDVPGNIHYGYVGRMARISSKALYEGGDWAAKGSVDDTWDKVAIGIGILLADFPTTVSYCGLIRASLPSLNTTGADGCAPCKTKYSTVVPGPLKLDIDIKLELPPISTGDFHPSMMGRE